MIESDLEGRLRAALGHSAAAMDGELGVPVDSGGVHRRSLPITQRRRHRARPVVLVAAAALIAVGTAAVVAGQWRSDSDAGSEAAPTSSSAPDQDPVAVAPPATLFPIDGSTYEDPVELVAAFMADRTAPANVPPDYAVTATVGEVQVLDDSLSAVAVSLQTADDSGDAAVLVRRTEDDYWVVTAAAVFGDELIEPRLDDGRLTATLATHAGGITYVAAYDATSGALLASTTLRTEFSVGDESPAPQALQLDVGAASTVALRYWNIVDPVEAYAFANFAELIVTRDPSIGSNDWSLFSQRPSTSPGDDVHTVYPATIGVIGWPDPADPDARVLPGLAVEPVLYAGPPAQASVWLFTDDEGRRCVEIQKLDGGQAAQCVDATTDAVLEAGTRTDSDGSTYVIGTTADTAAVAAVAVTGDRRDSLTLYVVDGWDVRVFAGRFVEPPERIELVGPDGAVVASHAP